MNKLIPHQEYYVSDDSVRSAIKSKRIRVFLGEDSNGQLWFEDAVGGEAYRWAYAAPIPKPEYVPWDAETRPLTGAYKRKDGNVIFIPTEFTAACVKVSNVWHAFNELLEKFDYIPDLTKEHETIPCGVLKDE